MKYKIALSYITIAILLNAEVFELGQVEISASATSLQKGDISVVTINSDHLKKNEIKRLSQLVKTTPGLYIDKKAQRCEQNFYIRGFDARRVPLFIDGVPVYVPYDGNADFGRFNTFDLSRIVVSKGASSVLYGANTMGGAVNLISKKPTKNIEGEFGYGFERGKDKGTFGNNINFNLGSKQEKFYIQLGASFMQDRGTQLSKAFKADDYGNEDGKRRENSVQKDTKFSLKFAYTPNETDEYALSYTNQKAHKEQPFYSGRYPHYIAQISKYWDWARWDKEGIYLLSNTKIKENLYLKTKLYHDTFKNRLNSYANRAMTKYNDKNSPSFYDDKSYGGGIELGWNIDDKNNLKFATSYKYDLHKEKNEIYDKSGVKKGEEPWQKMADKTYSFGLELGHKFSDYTSVVLGISHDTRDAIEAQDYIQLKGKKSPYEIYNFDISKRHALNYQIALKHSFDDNDQLSLSYAKKSYFASMKERYSKRFNRNTPNPYLKPEIAHHYEIAYIKDFSDNFSVETALFYSKIKDAIAGVNLKDNTKQYQNIDVADYKGFEFSTNYTATNTLNLGGNYTYIIAKYKNKNKRIYDLPKHKSFLYAEYKFAPKLSLYTSQELISSRHSQSSEDIKLGGFGITNIKFGYKPTDKLYFETGVSNLFDKNYEYKEGFPEEGRVFFGNIGYKF